MLLMDNAGIKRVNRALFGRHEVTDVISQRYDPMPGLDGRHGGEVFVNVQRAAERAASIRSKARGRSGKPRAWDESRELALYIAHGCNHLTGAEDAEAAGRSRMRRRDCGCASMPPDCKETTFGILVARATRARCTT